MMMKNTVQTNADTAFEKEIDKILRYFHLTLRDMINEARDNCPPPVMQSVTFAMCRMQPKLVIGMFDQEELRQKRILHGNLSGMREKLTARMKDSKNPLRSASTQEVKALLFGRGKEPDERCVMNDLVLYRNACMERLPVPDQLQKAEARVAGAFESAKTIALFGRRQCTYECVSALSERFSLHMQETLYRELSAYCEFAGKQLGGSGDEKPKQ